VRKRGAAVTGVAHLLKHADGLSWRIELVRLAGVAAGLEQIDE
jgi:hypothetical protein